MNAKLYIFVPLEFTGIQVKQKTFTTRCSERSEHLIVNTTLDILCSSYKGNFLTGVTGEAKNVHNKVLSI